MKRDPIKLSHTALSTFQECPRKFELRYLDRLVPQLWAEDSESLSVGRMFDRAISMWHDGQPADEIADWIDAACPNRPMDERTTDRYCRVLAMFRGYVHRYPRGSEAFTVVGLQCQIEDDVINPATGAPARLLTYDGILDGLLVWEDGGLWVWELKTTGRIDAAYLEKLWIAPQTGLYAVHVERTLGLPVAGILYDIVEKADKNIHRRAGETAEEYEARAVAARAKNASGKTSVKRQLPETWNEYLDRLTALHIERSNDMYHREMILMDRTRRAEVSSQLWAKGQAILACRRPPAVFYRNEQSCYTRWGDECEFLPICRSGDNPLVISNLFEQKKGGRHEQPQIVTDTTVTTDVTAIDELVLSTQNSSPF